MRARYTENRVVWLIVGVIAGLVIAAYWPHEAAHAMAVDRSSKIAICTAETTAGASDAVFVLDFVTGRLVGAAPNAQGQFTVRYGRNLAKDFNVAENAQYAIVPGTISISRIGGASPANSGLYVAELNSGIVALYAFPYAQTSRPTPPVAELVPVSTFNFKQATN